MKKKLALALILCMYPITKSMEVQAKYFCCPIKDKSAPKDKCAPKVQCNQACGKKATCLEGTELKNKFWVLK